MIHNFGQLFKKKNNLILLHNIVKMLAEYHGKTNGNLKKLKNRIKVDFKKIEYVNEFNNLAGLDKSGSNIGRSLEIKEN